MIQIRCVYRKEYAVARGDGLVEKRERVRERRRGRGRDKTNERESSVASRFSTFDQSRLVWGGSNEVA